MSSCLFSPRDPVDLTLPIHHAETVLDSVLAEAPAGTDVLDLHAAAGPLDEVRPAQLSQDRAIDRVARREPCLGAGLERRRRSAFRARADERDRGRSHAYNVAVAQATAADDAAPVNVRPVEREAVVCGYPCPSDARELGVERRRGLVVIEVDVDGADRARRRTSECPSRWTITSVPAASRQYRNARPSRDAAWIRLSSTGLRA